MSAVRPADVCRGLLAALDASEGRRKRRQRDTTADAIGLRIKRSILEAAVRDDPPAYGFEGWLLDRCLAAPRNVSTGAMRAMALEVLHEWELAEASQPFVAWLEAGAPSDDRGAEPPHRDVTAA